MSAPAPTKCGAKTRGDADDAGGLTPRGNVTERVENSNFANDSLVSVDNRVSSTFALMSSPATLRLVLCVSVGVGVLVRVRVRVLVRVRSRAHELVSSRACKNVFGYRSVTAVWLALALSCRRAAWSRPRVAGGCPPHVCVLDASAPLRSSMAAEVLCPSCLGESTRLALHTATSNAPPSTPRAILRV